jgi:hypothetical protein
METISIFRAISIANINNKYAQMSRKILMGNGVKIVPLSGARI